MFSVITRVAGGLFKAVLPAAPWILAGVVGAAAWHVTPVIGSGAQIRRAEAGEVKANTRAAQWQSTAEDMQRAAIAWEKSYRFSEKLRGEERDTSERASEAQAAQCTARVAEARQSARTIERIVTKEPTYDENRCPARELVDPGLVRDALRPGGSPG